MSKARAISLRVHFIGALTVLLHAGLLVTQRAIDRFLTRNELPEWLATRSPSATLWTLEALSAVLLAALFALYAFLLTDLRRQGRALLPLFLYPLLSSATLFTAAPTRSIDLYSYAAHGYIANLPGGNPYVTAARDLPPSAFRDQLLKSGWRPVHPATSYGPLTSLIEMAAVRIGHGARPSLATLKTIMVLSVFAAAGLIAWRLRRVPSAPAALGMAVFLWNPLVLIEACHEGHNDALLAALVL
ncbi:MAG: hypothetical protein MUF51_11385, partial [Vicinamibacteria bacterium]|nr:hypothetical protein [Vicinamibacteria bacterium]